MESNLTFGNRSERELDNLTISSNATGGSPALNDAVFVRTVFVLKIVYLVIGCFGFFSNLFVICIIALNRSMYKLTNAYIVNQSSIDAMAALFLFTTTVFEDDHARKRTAGWIADEILCRIWFTKVPLWGLLMSSSYGIIILTFERFLALVYPFYHRAKFIGNKVFNGVVMTSAWLIGPIFVAGFNAPTAGIVSTGDCTVYSDFPTRGTQILVGVLVIGANYFVPLMFLVFAYSRIACTLYKDLDPTRDGGGGSGNAGTEKRKQNMVNARNNVIKTLALVACFFVLCWSINQVYYFMYNLQYPVDFTSGFYNVTVIMIFVNCCVNPIIYSIQYKSFQEGVIRVFCRSRLDQQTTASNSLGVVPVTSAASLGVVPVTSAASLGVVPVTSAASLGVVPVTSAASLGVVPVTSVVFTSVVPVTSAAFLDAVPVASVVPTQFESDSHYM